MANAFRRQHYIPQFIIKNFRFNNDCVNYWDIRDNKWFDKYISNTFMRNYMYQDETNHPNDPSHIEHILSEFEREASELITNKILKDSEIVTTRKECERLRIFLSLLSFRSNSRMIQYKSARFTDKTKEVLDKYAADSNYLNLWKKEIETICKANSIKEIVESKTIDPIIKTEFLSGLVDLYMTIVESKNEEFILSDIYPTLELYLFPNRKRMRLHLLFPISPKRAIILSDIIFRDDYERTEIEEMIYQCSKIKNGCIVRPVTQYTEFGSYMPDDIFTYKVQTIDDDTVRYINSLILNEARVGLVYGNAQNIISSVSCFNSAVNTKTKHLKFEEFLKKNEKK